MQETARYQLAQKATKGPYRVRGSGETLCIVDKQSRYIAPKAKSTDFAQYEIDLENIAANADPATVMATIDELRKLRTEVLRHKCAILRFHNATLILMAEKNAINMAEAMDASKTLLEIAKEI